MKKLTILVGRLRRQERGPDRRHRGCHRGGRRGGGRRSLVRAAAVGTVALRSTARDWLRFLDSRCPGAILAATGLLLPALARRLTCVSNAFCKRR